MTRQALGELVQLDQEAIGRIERGERMRFDNLEPIAQALGVHVVELFAAPDASVEHSLALSPEVMRVATYIASRTAEDPTFAVRALKILREI